ncbi:hypothetical protein [Streptomyces yangpuensis]
MSRKASLYQGMFTAQAVQYRIPPVPDGIPGPRGAQPSGRETAG